MHRHEAVGTGIVEEIEDSLLGRAEPRVERDEGEPEVRTADPGELPAVLPFERLILRIAVPPPVVEISGMVKLLRAEPEQEGDAQIIGTERADLAVRAGQREREYLVRLHAVAAFPLHLAAGRDLIGEDVVKPRGMGEPEDLPRIVVGVAVAHEDQQRLLRIERRKRPAPVVEEQGSGIGLYEEAAVKEEMHDHFVCASI